MDRPPAAARPGGAPPPAAAIAPDTTPAFVAERRVGIETGEMTMAATGTSTAPGSGGSGQGMGAGAGSGQGGGGAGARWGAAQWMAIPTGAMFAPYLRPNAARERVEVTVTLQCVVPRPGRPKSCTLIDEQPAGYGYGRAVMSVWWRFRIRPVFKNAEAVPVPVQATLVFTGAHFRARDLSAAAR